MSFDPQLAQQQKNEALISVSKYMGSEIVSNVIPLSIDITKTERLTAEHIHSLQALEIDAARTAVLALASLATINELDHLGGGLDLLSALTLTLSLVDYQKSCLMD